MASGKDFLGFVLEQLSLVPDISCRPMMGEFLLYAGGVLFGGIYDDRLLVKKVPENSSYHMPEEIPYKNGKPMYFVEDVDNKGLLAEIVKATIEGLL